MQGVWRKISSKFWVHRNAEKRGESFRADRSLLSAAPLPIAGGKNLMLPCADLQRGQQQAHKQEIEIDGREIIQIKVTPQPSFSSSSRSFSLHQPKLVADQILHHS